MGILAFLFAFTLVFAPVWLVFKVAFVAVALSFKLTFWVLELAAMLIIGVFFSGSFLAVLGLMLMFNVIALPCWLLFCRR